MPLARTCARLLRFEHGMDVERISIANGVSSADNSYCSPLIIIKSLNRLPRSCGVTAERRTLHIERPRSGISSMRKAIRSCCFCEDAPVNEPSFSNVPKLIWICTKIIVYSGIQEACFQPILPTLINNNVISAQLPCPLKRQFGAFD